MTPVATGEVASVLAGSPVLPNLGKAGEAYRNLALRVAARLKAVGPDARSFCVTSAESGAGKTVTSLNLALALSEMTDVRTLLIDADTTRPTLHQYLRVSLEEGPTAVPDRRTPLAPTSNRCRSRAMAPRFSSTIRFPCTGARPR